MAATIQAEDVPEDRSIQVWNLDIEGNEAFSDIIIKDQMATDAFSFWEKLKFWDRTGHELEPLEVKKDVIRIQNYYNRRGFPRVKVGYRIEDRNKPWKKHVIFTVEEHEPIRIENINFRFREEKYQRHVLENQRFQRAQRKSEYKENGIYETIKRGEVVSSYEQALQNMGFAYASVAVEADVDTVRFSADLTIDLDLGPLTYINDISVAGDSTISDTYVVRESGLRKGNKYTLHAIQEAQREIFNHHLFRFATINIPEQEKDSSLDLSMQIRENELRTIEASAGFGTDEYLRGQLRWLHRNVMGKGHQFTSTVKASFIEQTINLDYLFPYAFNTKSSFVISPFAQHLLEENYELSRMGITNSLIYRYSRSITGSVSYQFTRNTELSQQQDKSLPDTTQSYDLSSVQLSGYYNEGFGRRSQKGWVLQPYAEVSGFWGSSTFQFQKLSLDVRRYTPLTPTTTLATRLQGGKIFAAQEDSLPNNIRYYVGGTNSVRGWSRNHLGPKRIVTDTIRSGNDADSTAFGEYIPTGGRTFLAFNIEIRQDIDELINNLGLTAFFDGGQVWRKDPDIDSRPLQFSVGGGVRYESPIGPVRLDVGYKINPSDADLNRFQGRDYGNVWDRIGIHISIGQAF